MNAKPKCERCGRTFAPDTRHIRAEYSWYPPESREDHLDEISYLCPDCAKDFEEFLEGGENHA